MPTDLPDNGGEEGASERGFGSTEGGGQNEWTKAYKSDPSLETYVRLRRSEPTAEIEVGVIGGFESMFYMRTEFERYGLDPDLLTGLLDSVPTAINETALQVMEAMIAARQREQAGETQLASRGEVMPLKLIDWIICCTLDALSWNDSLEVPRDMIVLIRERLGGSNPQYEQMGHAREQKSRAAIVAGIFRARGLTPTYKQVGDMLKVSPSTVMRWFGPGEFEAEAKHWSQFFDEKGRVRPGLPPELGVAPDS